MIRENEAVTSTFAFFYFTPKSLANIHYFLKQNLFVKIFFYRINVTVPLRLNGVPSLSKYSIR